jgi:glutamate formiminotransferase/formiminotetrahydrofolate cyclodeaminase
MTEVGPADAVRRAVIEAALAAHEDAGLSGLCAEGRWDAAVDAMRSLDLAQLEVGVHHADASAQTSTTELIDGVARAVAAVSASRAAPPGGGTVAASVAALAAALTQMVAGLTEGRPRYAHVTEEMRSVARAAGAHAVELIALVRRDADAFESLTAAYRQPKGTDEAATARAAAIERALLGATEAPLEIARQAASVAELAASVAERGNTNAAADAAVAALIADAACRAGALTVRVNAPGLRDRSAAAAAEETAEGFRAAGARASARAVAAAARLGGG